MTPKSVVDLVPQGFRLIAVTAMPGTGGSCVRAFYNAATREIFGVLTYYRPDDEKGVEERQSVIGPLPFDLLTPILTTLRDVQEMKTPQYIEE